jgi:hypothetical protein
LTWLGSVVASAGNSISSFIGGDSALAAPAVVPTTTLETIFVGSNNSGATPAPTTAPPTAADTRAYWDAVYNGVGYQGEPLGGNPLGPAGIVVGVTSFVVLAPVAAALPIATGAAAEGVAAEGVASEASSVLGQSFGKLGSVVENPELDITGFTDHGINQVITRGVSPGDLLGTVSNPSVVLQQSGGQYLFLSNQAGVVLNPAGSVITAYPSSMFGPGVLHIMSLLP